MKGKKTQKRTTPKTHVVVTHAGDKYEGSGSTVLEALLNVPLDWTKVKVKGTVTASRGKKSVERLFYMKQLRMMFANKLRKVGFARQLQDMLDTQ